MPTRLARWVCVLTALAAGSTFAADKSKEKKGKPATPPAATVEVGNGALGPLGVSGAVIGQATGNPKTGATVGFLIGPDAAVATPTQQFVITKPVGTWVRDVDLGDAKGRFTLEITDTRLTLKIDCVSGAKTANGRVDVDYSINKESTLFGVIDSCEVKSSEKVVLEKLGQLAKLSGQPFAVRFRVEDDGLTFKDFKGLGVGLGDKEPELITGVLTMLNGRYTKVDPSKPLSPLKASKKETYNGDPLLRQDQLLNESERPSPTPERIHGGILKADPPKEVVQQAKFEAPLPSVPTASTLWSLSTLPQSSGNLWFTPPVPDVPPLPVKLLPPLLAAEPLNVDPPPAVASAYAGPIGGAVSTPLRSDAAVVQAKSEVSAVEPPRLIPKLREDDCPKCDPPTDAEVMQVFNERRAKDGVSFELSHDEDGVTIVKHLVSDKVDAPRFYPLVGIGRSHCCRWECGVYYNDAKAGKPKLEVISIESNTMRMVVPASDTGIPQRMTEK